MNTFFNFPLSAPTLAKGEVGAPYQRLRLCVGAFCSIHKIFLIGISFAIAKDIPIVVGLRHYKNRLLADFYNHEWLSMSPILKVSTFLFIFNYDNFFIPTFFLHSSGNLGSRNCRRSNF